MTALRILREIAERGSFSAAAVATGYTQSAISRQVASLETAAGARLFNRTRGGAELTAAGQVLLRHAISALDELEVAARELAGASRTDRSVRVGAFASAGAALVPRALTAIRRGYPGIVVSTREGSTPSLVRALRAGTIDLAVLASAPPFRAPDSESPPLVVETVHESDLLLAVPANHRLASRGVVQVDDLRDQRWVASQSSGSETLLGVWPGLPGRARVAHTARDWLTKLQLVAAGCGITTISSVLLPVVPEGVRVLAVRGGSHERRRIVLARLPRKHRPGLDEVAEGFRAAAAEI